MAVICCQNSRVHSSMRCTAQPRNAGSTVSMHCLHLLVVGGVELRQRDHARLQRSACIAGRHVQRAAGRRLRQLPGQCMLPPTAAHHQHILEAAYGAAQRQAAAAGSGGGAGGAGLRHGGDAAGVRHLQGCHAAWRLQRGAALHKGWWRRCDARCLSMLRDTATAGQMPMLTNQGDGNAQSKTAFFFGAQPSRRRRLPLPDFGSLQQAMLALLVITHTGTAAQAPLNSCRSLPVNLHKVGGLAAAK